MFGFPVGDVFLLNWLLWHAFMLWGEFTVCYGVDLRMNTDFPLIEHMLSVYY